MNPWSSKPFWEEGRHKEQRLSWKKLIGKEIFHKRLNDADKDWCCWGLSLMDLVDGIHYQRAYDDCLHFAEPEDFAAGGCKPLGK